jgi:hypothetical protein
MAAERGGALRSLKRLGAYGATGLVGPALLLWSQAVLYGHPLQAGYKVPLNIFFSAERIPYNALLYPRNLIELHTWMVFGGLLLVPLWLARARRSDQDRRVAGIVATALGLIAVNYGVYLPYLTYEGWYWLRFLLPAMLGVFLLLAAATDCLRLWISHRWKWMSMLALAPSAVVLLWPQQHLRPQLGYPRLELMERYLREVLPDNAVILTFAHGGALSTATRRAILRLDLIEPEALEPILEQLVRRGHRPVFVIDVAIERSLVKDRFKDSPHAQFDWPARAEFVSSTSIVYHDVADREEFLNGERWVTDVLVAPPSTRGGSWSDYRAPNERVVFPVLGETLLLMNQLEITYRDVLGRPAMAAAVDSRQAVIWTRRYLRYRVHGCDHDTATNYVLQLLTHGGPAPPLCARPQEARFPQRNETFAFRRRLEAQLRGTGGAVKTFVDSEGAAVWLQQYLEYRVALCSHEAAVSAVVATISGRTVPTCAPD